MQKQSGKQFCVYLIIFPRDWSCWLPVVIYLIGPLDPKKKCNIVEMGFKRSPTRRGFVMHVFFFVMLSIQSIPSLSAGRVSWFGESWRRAANNLPSIYSLPKEGDVWEPLVNDDVGEVSEEGDVWPSSLRNSIAQFQMHSVRNLQSNFDRTTTIGDLSSLNSLPHMARQGSLDMISTSAHMFNPAMTDRKLIHRNSHKNKIQMCELSQLAKQVLCLTKPGCPVNSRSVWSTLFNKPSKRRKEYPTTNCENTMRNLREKFQVLVEKTGTRPETLRAAWRRFQDFENRRSSKHSRAKKLFELMGIKVFYDPSAEHVEVMALKDFTLENQFDGSNPELVMDIVVQVMKQLDVEDDIARKTSGHEGPVPAMWRDVHTVALAMCIKMPVSKKEEDNYEGNATWTNIEIVCHQIALLQGEKIEWEAGQENIEIYRRQVRRTDVVERRKKRKRADGFEPGWEERAEKRRKENESFGPMSAADKQRAAETRRQQLWIDAISVMPDDAYFSHIHKLHGGNINKLLDEVEDKCTAVPDARSVEDVFELGMSLIRQHMDENVNPEVFKDIEGFARKTVLEKMVIGDNFLGIGPKASKTTMEIEKMVEDGDVLGAWKEARSFHLLSLWVERRETYFKFARNDIILRGFEQ